MGIDSVLKKIGLNLFFFNLFDFCKVTQSATTIVFKEAIGNGSLVQNSPSPVRFPVFGWPGNQTLKH